MKVPQHSILPSVDLKVVASSELEDEIEKELTTAKASSSEGKIMKDVLKANKVSKKNRSSDTSSTPKEYDGED